MDHQAMQQISRQNAEAHHLTFDVQQATYMDRVESRKDQAQCFAHVLIIIRVRHFVLLVLSFALFCFTMFCVCPLVSQVILKVC